MPLAKILLTLASLAYPLLWYYGRGNGAFFWLAALMCALWLIRAAMPQTAAQRAVALLLSAFFAAVLVFRLPYDWRFQQNAERMANLCSRAQPLCW